MKDKRYPIYEYKTIRDMFLGTTSKVPNKVGFMEKRPGRKDFQNITYGKFRKDVVSLGAALIDKLSLKGEKIAIIGENSYMWAVSYFSVVCGVGTVVPIDKELPANEIVNLAKRSGAKAIIYSPRKREIIEEVKKEETALKYYIEMYPEEDHLDLRAEKGKDYTVNELMQIGWNLDEKILLDVPIDPNEFKILLFTSGTTANSKGVMLSNSNIMANLHAAIKIVYLYSDDVFFSVLPLHHSYEATVGMLLPVYNTIKIGYAGGLKTIASDLKLIKPTVILGVPALIENLFKKVSREIKKQGKEKLVRNVVNITEKLGRFGWSLRRKLLKKILDNLGGDIRLIVSAAAPIDPEIGRQIENYGIYFVQGYGLTETSPLATLVPINKRDMASVGIAAEKSEVKIVDKNEEGIGEVWIKGPNVALGYFEDEEETKKSFIDGWFKSGDLGYIDKKGYLFLTGRCKNLIITGNGKNVYPEEIENFINKIEYVKESMVYAVDDPKDKNETIISAAVTLDEAYFKEKYDSNMPSDEEIHELIWKEIKEINKTMVPYKWVKNLVVKKEDFVKTTTQKIKRFEEIKKLNQ